MIPGALPAVLRYSVEVATKHPDGRAMVDVRQVGGWLELQGPLSHAFGDRPAEDPAECDAEAPQVARFWHCGTVAPKPGDLITAGTSHGAPIATFDVLMTHADHLLVGFHKPAATVPDHERALRAA